MKTKFLTIILFIFAFGCNEGKKTEIHYFKDDRTGLCFAEIGIRRNNNYSFTNIPCEKVEKFFDK